MQVKSDSIVFDRLIDVSANAGQMLGDDSAIEIRFPAGHMLRQANAAADSPDVSLEDIADRATNSGARLKKLFYKV